MSTATPKYRLMVRYGSFPAMSWVRHTDGQLVPLRTRAQARERQAEVQASHPGCDVWIERIYLGPGWRWWMRIERRLRRFR